VPSYPAEVDGHVSIGHWASQFCRLCGRCWTLYLRKFRSTPYFIIIYNAVILRRHLHRVDLRPITWVCPTINLAEPHRSREILTSNVQQNLQVVIGSNATHPPPVMERWWQVPNSSRYDIVLQSRCGTVTRLSTEPGTGTNKW